MLRCKVIHAVVRTLPLKTVWDQAFHGCSGGRE